MNKYEQLQKKTKYYVIFSRKLFYVTIVLCLNILWLKAVDELLLGKHELAYVNMTL